jgi:hypothetical protein
VRSEGLVTFRISIHLIRSRTRDLPACSVVPSPLHYCMPPSPITIHSVMTFMMTSCSQLDCSSFHTCWHTFLCSSLPISSSLCWHSRLTSLILNVVFLRATHCFKSVQISSTGLKFGWSGWSVSTAWFFACYNLLNYVTFVLWLIHTGYIVQLSFQHAVIRQDVSFQQPGFHFEIVCLNVVLWAVADVHSGVWW